MAYLPQILDLQAPFRVGELVRMGRYPQEGSLALSVEEALHIVGLQGKAKTHLTELSGGERRRAYIAMTLVQGARVLLLDEPLASLDIKYQFGLYRLLKDITRRKRRFRIHVSSRYRDGSHAGSASFGEGGSFDCSRRSR